MRKALKMKKVKERDEEVEKCVKRFPPIQKMTKQIIESITKNTEADLMINTANDTHLQILVLNDTLRRKRRTKSTRKVAKSIHHRLAIIPLTMNENISESTKGASIIERDLKIYSFYLSLLNFYLKH